MSHRDYGYPPRYHQPLVDLQPHCRDVVLLVPRPGRRPAYQSQPPAEPNRVRKPLVEESGHPIGVHPQALSSYLRNRVF